MWNTDDRQKKAMVGFSTKTLRINGRENLEKSPIVEIVYEIKNTSHFIEMLYTEKPTLHAIDIAIPSPYTQLINILLRIIKKI